MRTAKPHAGSRRGPARIPWSDREVSRLVALWGMKLSNAEIARRLNRGETAIAVKASRINLPPRNADQPARPGARARNCLRCASPFHSSGPGNRICDPCKETQDWLNGDADRFLNADI